jgi:DNA invertase Pin-like site-specific DNA recombinase
VEDTALVVWKFDRFGRSLRHLVTALAEFKSLGIDLLAQPEGVDTTSPAGELVFQIFGAIAQFERSLIVEGVRAAIRLSLSLSLPLGNFRQRDRQRAAT